MKSNEFVIPFVGLKIGKHLFEYHIDSAFFEYYECEKCLNRYKERSGLWRHNKKCGTENITSNAIIEKKQDDSFDIKQMFLKVIEQNQELQKQVIELCKEKSMTVNNNNTINNNNQKFNMNFFLNEQCKDALDIMDFVNSLHLNLEDLENTGKVGYVKGVSDIFLRGLRELDVYKRPIHCSDLKREVMYVKDNNVWEKDEDKKKMKKAVHYIAGRNFKQIHEWMDQNPDSRDIKTKKHDQYMTIVNKCTGGFDAEEDDALFNKVITNVAKEVTIEK
jgi:DNA-binding ferritin-like protein